ncbi:hypothetical protein PQR02_33960 [Paraburkholderia sediminicola]|uniref:Uncharacterized protein n=1 Tax=Paraburkholderia rhynchosiae TaxID=487049 RepID=A0ACC7NKG5_9BURK
MNKGIIRIGGFSLAAVWRVLPKTDSRDVKPITRAAAINRSALPLRSIFSPTSRGQSTDSIAQSDSVGPTGGPHLFRMNFPSS